MWHLQILNVIVLCACTQPYKQRRFISLSISKVPILLFCNLILRGVTCFYKLSRTFPPGSSIWLHRGITVSLLPQTLSPLINTRIDINEHNALLFPFHIISKIPFLAEIDTGSFAHYRHRFSTPGTPWPIPLNKMWYSIDIGLVHFVR